MPLINKQPFKPNPIPENLGPDDEVFYHELTNEIFTSHDAFFDRFLFCNSLIWTCKRTGKSGLTYKEALDSEQQEAVRKKKGKREKKEQQESLVGGNNDDKNEGEPVKKKKKKYPYDPKKYSMPVPEGFDPSLLTPTGKIDGRKLKSKKNKELAEELLLQTQSLQETSETTSTTKKGGKQKKKEDEVRKKEEEVRRKEEETKKKAQLQAELAKERELEAKRKKEAAALARQLERQKKEEERKKAAAFLQNWEKKCEDLERDDLKRLPQPTRLDCDIPEKLFGDSMFIMESLYNLHELYNFSTIFPDGLSFDNLEEILLEKNDDGPLGTLVQFLLKWILDTQPTNDGYGLDDDPLKPESHKVDESKANSSKDDSTETEIDNHEHSVNGLGSEAGEDEEEEVDHEEENDDKEVRMNDLIGSAIRAAQEVKKSLSKPLPEMELNSSTVTEILRLHLLQSGSFPKGRTIYNGWYSSREDPGLWLCMQEPDLIKKLGETTIYELDIEERIKIIHTLIYQLFSFIRSRLYIESASEQLTELRKTYRKEAAEFARWDRENCVKRMQLPKKKGEQQQTTNHASNHNQQTSDKSGVNNLDPHVDIKTEHHSNPGSVHGDTSENGYDKTDTKDTHQLKSCLKANGTTSSTNETLTSANDNDDMPHSRKKITFKTGMNSAIEDDGLGNGEHYTEKNNNDDTEQSYEELEQAYQQNLVDYEDYQRERAIRLEELNQTLLELRTSLRTNQSVYGVHPIGRDRAYRRYWLFQSLSGLFVELDDEYVGRCLPEATPLESSYKRLFNKENPLMHPNEADLIRAKTNGVQNSTTIDNPNDQHTMQVNVDKFQDSDQMEIDDIKVENGTGGQTEEQDKDVDRPNGEQNDDHSEEASIITDEMNYCTGNETTCAIHGQRRLSQPRWWFYHTPESIDSLVDSLNKRGHRESELLDVLTSESLIIKPRVAECPAYKLNKEILEQSGIRRSRRLKVKGSKRRGRNRDYD